jgi:C-terminal processing protease CtpA/Prc
MTITSFSVFAGEPIKLGITGNIETDGFFSPIITSYTVNKVRPESSVDKAGIVAGHKVISIENCKIPECPTSQAKKLMRSESGETVHLLVEDNEGNQIPIDVELSVKSV